jgi:hypothetical protein
MRSAAGGRGESSTYPAGTHRGNFTVGWLPRQPTRIAPDSVQIGAERAAKGEDARTKLRYFSALRRLGRRKAMQLSQMWREHLQAGCPPEMRGLSIAGTAARDLDAEITACVSACVTHSLKMDSRIERRLHDISYALEHLDPVSPEVAAYCSRLNKLVSAVLVNATPAADAADADRASGSDTARIAVRPGVRRR